jgi:hypothetical protein
LKYRLEVCDPDLFKKRLKTRCGERGNIVRRIGKVLEIGGQPVKANVEFSFTRNPSTG